MYVTKFVKINTPLLNKDPQIVVLTTAEDQQIEIELDKFCMENQLKLKKLINLPAPLSTNTLLQVAIFVDSTFQE